MASKKIKKEEQSPLVRVEREVFEKVKKYTETTRQSIGGFFTLAAEEKLIKERK